MTVVINGTSGITDVNGSAAAPAITGTDTDTGVFFGTNTVSLSTGGTERLQVDSSGNLGLGVTPSAWGSGYKALDIQYLGISNTGAGTVDCSFTQNGYYNGTNWIAKYTSPSKRYSISDSGFIWYNGASATAGNAISFTQAMTLDASGNLGLGQTSLSNSKLWVLGSGTTQMILGYNGTSTNYIDCDTQIFRNFAGTERARIDSSGNLLVGTTTGAVNSVGSSLAPDGLIRAVKSGSTSAASTMEVYSTGAGAYRFFVGMQGQVYATVTTISGISDVRFKENIQDLDVGLDAIMSLKPRKFDWKEGKGADIKNARGFIAQEFEEVFPDLIDEWKDPAPEGEEPYKSVRADLIPVLVKAIQEQQQIITQLQADVAALKGQA